jgi:hypothetical protein
MTHRETDDSGYKAVRDGVTSTVCTAPMSSATAEVNA